MERAHQGTGIGAVLSGGASIGQEVACRQSHVDGELSQLENLADRLQACFDELTARLHPALHFTPINAIGSEAGPENSIAPLADRLRKVRQRLENLETSIGRIYRAIEL